MAVIPRRCGCRGWDATPARRWSTLADRTLLPSLPTWVSPGGNVLACLFASCLCGHLVIKCLLMSWLYLPLLFILTHKLFYANGFPVVCVLSVALGIPPLLLLLSLSFNSFFFLSYFVILFTFLFSTFSFSSSSFSLLFSYSFSSLFSVSSPGCAVNSSITKIKSNTFFSFPRTTSFCFVSSYP